MRVFHLHLTDVTPSPDFPWARPTFPAFAFLVDHPEGPALIDTGVGLDVHAHRLTHRDAPADPSILTPTGPLVQST